MRYFLIILSLIFVSGCATGPSQAELEYKAFDRVVSEKVSKGKMSPAEADLARQQYAGSLRHRESSIEANETESALGMMLMMK